MSILPWKRWIVSRFSVLWDLFEHVCSSILFCQWICEHILLKTLDCFTIFVFLRFIWTYMFIKFLLPTDLWTFISETVELFHGFVSLRFVWTCMFINFLLPTDLWTFISKTVELFNDFRFTEIYLNIYVHQIPFANWFVNIFLWNCWIVSWFLCLPQL